VEEEYKPSAFASIRPLDLLVSLKFSPTQYLVADRRFMDYKDVNKALYWQRD
jgi:hypothetical protein